MGNARAKARIAFKEAVHAIAIAREDHDQIHNEIYNDVHRGRIGAGEISTLLNVNRGMLNANIALLTALAEFHLEPAAADALERLPGIS